MHKKQRAVQTVAVAIVLIVAFAIALVLPAYAADIVISAEITGKTDAIDRNGNAYTRFIIVEDRETGGVKYQAGVPTMAFGDMKGKTSELDVGDTLHAVVSAREFNGRKSFTIQSLITEQ